MADEFARFRALADAIRADFPEKASEIDRLVAEAESSQRPAASLNIGLSVRCRVEKFDGEITPDKEPVAVIEREERL